MGQHQETTARQGMNATSCAVQQDTASPEVCKASSMFLAYDNMTVSCGKCSNWIELSGNDPRRRVDGYGFHFNAEGDAQDFTCVACGCKAEDRYFVTGECDECAEPDEREVTDEILAALGRHSV